MPVATATPALTLLASDRWRSSLDPTKVVQVDRPGRGGVAVRRGAGLVRRAEPGPAGALLLEARRDTDGVELAIWGPPETPDAAIGDAREALLGWVGLRDDPGEFAAVVGGHPRLRAFVRRLGSPRLSRLPRVGEAVGRAVIAQLVQAAEAQRSTAQLVGLLGAPAPAGLRCWPTRERLGTTPAHVLRRCGLSLRGCRALHAAAVEEPRLAPMVGDWARLDRRLRALPGIGVWTSAEVRLALGDPDAVSVGDYNLPALVGQVLTGQERPRAAWDDAQMLALLAPFAGQRGRVIRLCELAVRRRLVTGPRRRAPRAALSAHRYW